MTARRQASYDPAQDAEASYFAAIEAKRLRGDHLAKMYCSECNRYERFHILLDGEMCGMCGLLVDCAA